MAISPKNAILTVGSMAFDSIQTPAGKVDSTLGGSVNYFSIAASFFAPIHVVGVVGDDFPKSHLQWLSERNIDVSGVQVVPGKTFHWVGSYDGHMNEAKTLNTSLNVFEHFNPQLSLIHKNAPYLFLANIDPILQQSVLDQASNPKLIACDSMNFWITGKPTEVKKTLSRVDILSINETEAFLLSEETHLERAAKKILLMGPSVVIIKRGEYGAALFTQKETFLAPAFLVDKVADPTGAGDSFAGAFMGYIATAEVSRDLATKNPDLWENTLRKAVLAGCVMASFTVEDFGIQRLMRLSKDELATRQEKLMKMIRVQ